MRTAASQQVKDLGSTTFRLSRLHLLALARALGVRAAGGWRAYDRRPREEVLRRLILAQRRRAILTAPPRHAGQYIRSLGFLVRCPPEIAWHVLGYWRCQYTADTQLIDQLGVH